jgi:hypothetical protein
MNNSSLYIPTNSTCLALYFGTGLIMPSEYYGRNIETIQNRISNAIIITEQKWYQGINCSIEIILTDNERTILKPIEGVNGAYEFSGCVPISRILNIFFNDNNQMETTVWNINRGTAFVPNRILKVDSEKNDSKDTLNIQETNLPISQDIRDKAKRFDVLLGGFAFMKVGTQPEMSVTHNYFPTLGYFNQLVSEQVKDAQNKNKIEFNYKYSGLFSSRENEWTKWTRYIYKDLKKEDVEIIAKNEKVKLETKLGNIKLDTINPDTVLYDLALLATYGINKTKSVDDLISFINRSNLSQDKIEEIALLFGLNIGYSKLRNSYKAYNREVHVKFDLDTKLDYYTIESIYLFVFKGERDIRELQYLNPVLPSSIPTNKPARSNFETYDILDTTVIFKKKAVAGIVSKAPYEDFINELTKEICTWSSAVLKADEAETKKYLTNKFGPSLLKLCEQSVTTNPLPTPVQSVQLVNPGKKEPQVSVIHNDELETLSFSKLKEAAKEKGIKDFKKFKAGSVKEMIELIDIIRNTPTIL